MRFARVTILRLSALATAMAALGCGTTKWSDTSRTATEQLLISDAVDRAVSQIDFGVLAGRSVWLDTKYINGTVDEKYTVGTLRQHMLASGCIIKESVEDSDYIVEVRTGAVGTNRNELLFGVPATSLPTGGMFPMAPSSIPELPLMKRTNQQGVCKLAVFAYDRVSGRPVWQSGTRQVASKAKDIWVFGTGPFQSGTIYDGKVKFAGEKLTVPLQGEQKVAQHNDEVSVSRELLFAQPPHDSAVATHAPATRPATPAAAQAGRPAPQVAGAPPAAPRIYPPIPHSAPHEGIPAQYTEPEGRGLRASRPPALLER